LTLHAPDETIVLTIPLSVRDRQASPVIPSLFRLLPNPNDAQPALIAIDIGSSAVKVVELSGSKQKKLTAIGLEVLPPGAVVDGQLQSPEIVETVLRELLKKMKIAPRAAGSRSPWWQLGHHQKLNIQADKDKDVSEQAYYEAEQQFQIDMAELEFDHINLSPLAKKDETTPVVAVGAKREMIEQYLALVRSIGMRTGCVECDVFSAANMFEYNYGTVEGLMALVNVGAATTQVSLIHHGDYLFTRDVAIAGEEYTRQIMQALGVGRDNADSLKVAVSQSVGSAPPKCRKSWAASTSNWLMKSRSRSIISFKAATRRRAPGSPAFFLRAAVRAPWASTSPWPRRFRSRCRF